MPERNVGKQPCLTVYQEITLARLDAGDLGPDERSTPR
jgi:hypothetical protein